MCLSVYVCVYIYIYMYMSIQMCTCIRINVYDSPHLGTAAGLIAEVAGQAKVVLPGLVSGSRV